MFARLFRRKTVDAAAREIYVQLVGQAREPAFYTSFGVADTVEGRFDLLVLHVFLALYRLKGEGEEASGRGQAVFDIFFADMDDSLRELGVGDLAVPKRIKKMAEGFYGRTAAYDAALDAGDEAALAAAIGRNVLGGHGNGEEEAALARYARAVAARLAAIPLADVLAGRLSFPAPEDFQPQTARPIS